MQMFHKLYKKTSTGATQTWWMEQDEQKYRTYSGQLNSPNIVISEWTTCQVKNFGKKNGTNPTQQATLEIEAQYKKKLAQGNYKENIDDIDEDNYFKPMLAKNYNDYPLTQKDFENGVSIQPKLDGIRCIAKIDGLWSRQGKPIVSCPHIFEALKPVLEKYPTLVLDGELYNHELKHDFNQIISLARQSKPTKEDLEKSKEKVQYHIYDNCFPGDDTDFVNRIAAANHFLRLNPSPYLKTVTTHTFINFKEDLRYDTLSVDKFYTKFVEQGYEGQIVRLNTPYENKRTKNLLKRKEFLDEEFEIVEIEEGIGNRSGMAGAVKYKLHNGTTFRSGIKGGFDFYKKLFLEAKEYVGGQGKVRFFNWTPDGIPRFPVTVDILKGKRED